MRRLAVVLALTLPMMAAPAPWPPTHQRLPSTPYPLGNAVLAIAMV